MRRHCFPFLSRPGSLHGANGRPGRRTARLRNPLHLRRRAPATVPDRVSRWTLPVARHCLGCAREGAGRPALVPPVSRRAGHARRRTPLDAVEPELEPAVRRMPLHRSAEELRSLHAELPHDLGRDGCRLRGVPWPWIVARRLGRGFFRRQRGGRRHQGPPHPPRRAPGHRLADRPADGEATAKHATKHGHRDPTLCPLSLTTRRDFRGLPVRPAAHGHAPSGSLDRRPLPRGWPDRSRGLRIWLLPAEPHGQRRCDLQRLPRSARAATRGAGGWRLHAMPPAGSLRLASAPLPPRRLGRGELRRVPHASPGVHGDRCAPGPQLPRPATGSLRPARHAERLHRLPHRQVGRLGGSPGARLVRPRRRRVAALRRSAPRGSNFRRRRRGPPGGVAARRRAASVGTRHGGGGARPLVEPGFVGNSFRCARRFGSAGAHGSARSAGGVAPRAALFPGWTAAHRSGAGGATPGRRCARRRQREACGVGTRRLRPRGGGVHGGARS